MQGLFVGVEGEASGRAFGFAHILAQGVVHFHDAGVLVRAVLGSQPRGELQRRCVARAAAGSPCG
jgi:hypothetical protein